MKLDEKAIGGGGVGTRAVWWVQLLVLKMEGKRENSLEVKIFIRGADDYLPGNIVEIELRNFMTFNHLVCKPGSRLNLVIGPNGSGKSSLVCAIALGLGGEPQLLGRAGSVGAFVKRGEDSGYTKITLRGDTPDEKIIIMRKIDARNKSEWLYNGRGASKKEVLDIIQKFNIQVNNLTQFLPQDRVCEFAKLSPVRLLEETEKAVGDPQLPVLHRALIDTSAELQRSEQASAVEKNRETLSHQKALNAEQERDVERVRQRDELLSKAESMKKKLPWLKYDMKKSEYLKLHNPYKMSQEITPVSDIDPMMDEGNILVRCISIWYNHPPGKPEMKWGLEMVLQDEQGNRIQVSVKKDGLSKFQPILQEGSCYKISNFGVGENGGKFPLLNHKYRINFYKNTSVTRVNKFDNNNVEDKVECVTKPEEWAPDEWYYEAELQCYMLES
ncbi:structural maintenance of chromosomes protein 5 [Tanacetum coccineum]